MKSLSENSEAQRSFCFFECKLANENLEGKGWFTIILG